MSPPAPRVPVPPGGFREIAVIRLSSLGDVVLTLPVVHALARAWPGARLHYWVKEEFADVVRNDPAISHVRPLERDARGIEDLVSMSAELEDCDLIVDLQDNLRSRVLTLRQGARLLRVRRDRLQRIRWVKAKWSRPAPVAHATTRYARTLTPLALEATAAPRMRVSEAADHWAAEWLGGPEEGPWVGLCPAARHATKRWPEEYWLELLDHAARRRWRVAVFSLPRERDSLPRLAAAVAGSSARWCVEPLERQAALLGRMDAVACGDTGLMHVAAARGARVVAIFGSTSPVLGFAPAGEGHRVLCRNEPCQPCTLHGRDSCPLGHFRCMRELKAPEVAGAATELVESAIRR